MKLRFILLVFAATNLWSQTASPSADYDVKPITLQGATGGVGLDYLAYDAGTGKLWVPASNLGTVNVIDGKTDGITEISGFKIIDTERRGQKRKIGPTSATIGDGVVYVGNRGDASVCVVDPKKLARGECVAASNDNSVMPDGVLYVAATKEVWATTRPVGASNFDAAKSLQIFDASDAKHLKWKAAIPLENWGEGYAVDNKRGLFYTNVEQIGQTLAIDVRTKKIVSKWNPGSTQVGGVALDTARGFLFIACGNRVVSLDAAHDGKFLDSIQTGAGLDNIDYSPDRKLLYAAAGQAAMLTIAEVSDDGKFHLKAAVPTLNGARNVVATKEGTAYVIDPAGGRILKVTPK